MYKVIGHYKKLTLIKSQAGFLAIPTKALKQAIGRKDHKMKVVNPVFAVIDGALHVFTRPEWAEGRKAGLAEFLPYCSISQREENRKERMEGELSIGNV